jgi:hypothetical protein
MADDETTDSPLTRWDYTNDVLATLLLVSLACVVAYAALYSVQVKAEIWAPYATSCLLAAIWAFGEQSVTALKKLRK